MRSDNRGNDPGNDPQATFRSGAIFGAALVAFSISLPLLMHACNPFVPGRHPDGLTPCVATDSGAMRRDSAGACVRATEGR